MPWLINAAQLDKFRKSQKNIIILDATWYLPSENRDAYAEFLEGHIPGARFLNLDEFHDTHSALPNMLLRDEHLIRQKISSLGITNDYKIILYDRSPLHSSCRALWMFKVFGHNSNQLYILDGGFGAWQKYGGKTETGEPRQVAPKIYMVNFQAPLIRTLVQIKTNLHHPTEQIVDMRHPVRYAGGADHRPNVRAGHIPGSYSFPYQTMFDSLTLQWKPLEKIRKQLISIGVNLEAPIVTMCGSGMTASILNFALDLMNQQQHALYDGSWSEWGAATLYQGESSLDERPVVRSVDL